MSHVISIRLPISHVESGEGDKIFIAPSTVTVKLKTLLLSVPSLTVTGTVSVPEKSAEDVIVLPMRV